MQKKDEHFGTSVSKAIGHVTQTETETKVAQK